MPTSATTRSVSARSRFALGVASALLVAVGPFAAISPAQSPDIKAKGPDYTSIVIFGDSLSDTGNVAHLTQAKYGIRVPGPVADYTDGRFTDGADTYAPAQKYFGVWVEQLAASFPSKPKIKDSLDGGTDYAYGFATTGAGTAAFTFGPGDAYSVPVDNIGKQITTYLATHPKITDKTLFIVWGGAIDLLYATSEDDVLEAGIRQTVNIERLVEAGATQFIIPNLPPLGLTPRLNGSPLTSVPANAASALYNQTLASGISLVRDVNPFKHLVLMQLDVFSLFEAIVAKPSKFALADITEPSQDQPIDPDTYLFWDDLHPTTRGHNILAATAEALIVAKKAGGTVKIGRADLGAAHQDVPAQ
jgi:outer membrane lipase/esterase